MADTYKKLAQLFAPSSAGALYTVPALTSAIVKHISVVNTDSSTRTISLLQSGTTGVNTLLPSTPIAAGGSADYEGTITMATGDTLQVVASVASKLAVTVHGLEIS